MAHPTSERVNLTLGAGTSNPQGRSVPWDGTAGDLARILRDHMGHETWWAPGRFRYDYRKVSTEPGDEPRWLGSRIVGVDIDFSDGTRGHAPLPAAIADAIAANPPPCSLWHLSPAGLRIVFILDREVTDLAFWRRVARACVRIVSEWITHAGLTGLEIDAGATCDPARFFFTPNCHAKGADREAEVHVTGEGPYCPTALLESTEDAGWYSAGASVDTRDTVDTSASERASVHVVPVVHAPAPAESSDAVTTPYGHAAVLAESERVLRAEPGNRNNTLFKAAASLAALVAGGEVAADDATRALLGCAVRGGLPQAEAEGTIVSAFRAGARQPRKAPPPKDAEPTSTTDSEPWGDPVPLVGGVYGPRLPIEVLPTWMRDAVTHIAANVQAPLDYVIVIALGLVAGSLAGRWALRFNGYTVHPNLYILGVLISGERKSAPFGVLLRGVHRAARTLRETRDGEIQDHGARRAALASTEKALARKHRNGEVQDSDYEAAVKALAEHDAAAPRPFVMIVDDCTPERASDVALGTGGLLRIYGDEGAFLQHLLGRYSNAPAVEIALKGWDGGPVDVARVNRPDVHIARALVCIVAAVQPTVLADVARNPPLLRRGALARFLIVMPLGLAGTRRARGAAVQELLVSQLADRLQAMYERRPAAHDADGLPDPVDVSLSPGAEDVFSAWFDALEARRGPNGDLGTAGDFVNKADGNCLKIALALYAAECELLAAPYQGHHQVDAATMERACRFMNVQLEHQILARSLGGLDPMTSAGLAILDHVRRHPERFKGKVALRDVYRAVRRQVADSAEAAAALEYLETMGWCRIDGPVQVGRGRKSPLLAFHPDALTHDPRGVDTRDYVDTSPAEGPSVHSVPSVHASKGDFDTPPTPGMAS